MFQGALWADGSRGTYNALLKWNKNKINPSVDKDLTKRGWYRLTNGGENPAQAHFLSYSEEMSPSPLRYMNIFQLDRHLACSWHPCKARLNTCMAIQFVRGGVIKQMCVDAVLFGALSAVLKTRLPPVKTIKRLSLAIKYPVNGPKFDSRLPLFPNKTRLRF